MFNKIPHFPSYSKWLKQKPSRDFFVSELILTWPFRIFPAIDSTKSKISSIPKNIKDTLRKKQSIKMIFNSSSPIMEFTTLIDQKLCVGLYGSKSVLKNQFLVKYEYFWNQKRKKALKLILTRWRSKHCDSRPTRVWTSQSKKKLKNTRNDKVILYPTLNPLFSPCLECRMWRLDSEKVLNII